MFDERALARHVAFVHAADLRDGDVRFIDEEQVIVAREKVHQVEGARAGGAAVEVARIIFDAGAVAHLLDHFEVVARAHFEALCFEQFALVAQHFEARVEFGGDAFERVGEIVFGHHVMLGGEDRGALDDFDDFAGERVNFLDFGDGVEVQFDADRGFVIGREDFDGVTAHAELAAREIKFVALVVVFREAAQQRGAVDDLAFFHEHGHLGIQVGRTQAVDAGDAGDDNHIGARHERGGRGQAQAVDVLVDGRIFFDVNVARGDVGLGLVIIVIADEISHGVVGEEAFEFAVELRGERFVVAQDQRGFLQALDHVGHGEGLAGAGDAEQRLVAATFFQAGDELVDGFGLVAGGGVVGAEFKHF